MSTNCLSLRGGGIRGYATAILLAELERQTGRQCADIFDLIVGTSVGGIVATGLALKIPALDLVSFFEVEGPAIFKARTFAPLLTSLGRPKFNTSNLIDALERHFIKETRLGHVFTKLMVTATRYRGDQSQLWKSWKHPDLSASLAAASSAAAVTYFDPVNIGGFDYGDGGMFANNPTACAVIECLKLWPSHEVRVVDIATPANKSHFDPRGGGLIQAAPHVADLFIGAGEDCMSYIAKWLVGNGKIVSVEPPLLMAAQNIGDVTPNNLLRLRECAEFGMDNTISDVRALFGI